MEIFETNNYDTLTLEKVPKSFWRGFPKVQGVVVFIKPNLVSPETGWDYCSTTRLEVTELVIQKVLKEGAKKIIVGECGFKDQWEATIHSTEYETLIEKYDKVELIPLQDGENFHKFTLRRIPNYQSLFGVRFSDYLLESDVIINLPKLKVHCMSGITGAIKNMMGTMIQKGSMHPRGNKVILHKRLADLYKLTTVMVDFIVMDGIIGSEYSEQCGLPKETGVLLSGTNQWKIDVAAAKLMGFDPATIKYLWYINQKFDSVTVPKHLIQKYEKPLTWK